MTLKCLDYFYIAILKRNNNNSNYYSTHLYLYNSPTNYSITFNNSI